MAKSVQMYSHGEPQVIVAQEAAGTANDFYDGDLVKFNGSGLLVLASDGIIAGIARKTATGTINTKLELELLDPNAIYAIKAQAATTPAQVDVGESWSLAYAAGACTLAAAAGSEKEVYIVGLHPEDTPAAGTRVLVRFSTTKTFDDGAA